MKEYRLPGLFLSGIVMVVLGPVLLTGRTFFVRDITYIFHPWKVLAAEMLQSGTFPAWNPYVFCGMPFMANWQSGIFSPLGVPFYFFQFAVALKIFHVAILVIGAIFSFLWARSFGLRRWAATAVMVVWSCNGYLLCRLEFLSFCSTSVWLFAGLMFTRHPVILALLMACSFFGGHPIFVLISIVVAIFGGMDRSSTLSGTVRDLSIAAGLLSLIVACQALPTFELLHYSYRMRSGLSFETLMTNQIAFTDLLRSLSPWLHLPSIVPVGGEKYPWAVTFHVGLLSAMVAVAGMFVRQYRRYVFLAVALMGAGILLALGTHTPVYPFLVQVLPGFSLLRYPTQYMLLFVLGAIVLVGLGVRTLSRVAPYLVLLIAVELCVLGWRYQDTVPDEYFHHTGAVARRIQSTAVATERFILSPGTERDRRMPGMSVERAWQSARGMLYNLTALPYHIPNAYGSGEPLTIDLIEKAVDTAYSAPSARAAADAFQALGVRYVLARKQIPRDSGYIDEGDSLYTLVRRGSLWEFPGTVRLCSVQPGSVLLATSASAPGRLLWKETAMPGWSIYIDNQRQSFVTTGGPFMTCVVPRGNHMVLYRYFPLCLAAGCAVTICALILLMAYGAARLTRGARP